MKKIILTIFLIFWCGLILFLSFQTGPDTADTSLGLTEFILHIFMGKNVPYETLAYCHMTFRLWAHPAIFFCYAILALEVAEEFIGKKVLCIALAVASGVILAVVSEVGKWNVPGRHCDVKEMMLNIAGVLAGTFLVWVIQGIRKRV